MSGKKTKEEGTEEAKAEGPRRFADMCGRMMSGEMADCCGPQMRERISQWMAGCQAKGKD